MQRTEHQHHTPEQVRGYLREALEIVDELDTPGDLRQIAFGKAVELLSGKQIFFEQAAVDLSRLKLPGAG